MKHVRTFTTDDGGSSMELIEIDTAAAGFVPGKPEMGVSPARPARDAKFLRVAADWDGGWHPTPVEQYLTVLQGGFEVETTDGRKHLLGVGDIVLLADTSGRGHRSVMKSGEETWALAVALE